jgi:hypothetical protein
VIIVVIWLDVLEDKYHRHGRNVTFMPDQNIILLYPEDGQLILTELQGATSQKPVI